MLEHQEVVVYFPKNSTDVVLEYKQVYIIKKQLHFKKVSQCVNYCRRFCLDPVIGNSIYIANQDVVPEVFQPKKKGGAR